VVRSIPVTTAPGVQLTGGYRLLDADGDERGAGGIAVSATPDGDLRVVLDLTVATPGDYTVELRVCGGGLCADPARFDLDILPANIAPTATVEIDGAVSEADVATAEAEGADADDDSVALTYRWLRNGVVIDGAADASLELMGIVEAGDVLTVEVTPDDGTTAGHAASASLLVRADPDRRPSPDR
jgi:hypothetical protein